MGDDELRRSLEKLLKDGLETDWKDRAYTSDQVNFVTNKLRSLAVDDWPEKLKVAGFTLVPFGEDDEVSQSCKTCMYYLKHRRFCELPELNCPVEPEWSCILWRI